MKGAGDAVFLVLVDEAQGLEPDPGSRDNNIAIKLAHGTTEQIKARVVFGGLSDTPSRLRKVGVSKRLASGSLHQLGVLTSDEAFDLIKAFLNHAPFGLDRLQFDHDLITKTIVQASDCYPRHVQAYLTGLATEFSENAHIDIDRALDAGRMHRIDFYEEIITDADLRGFKCVIASLAQSKPFDEPIVFGDFAQATQDILGMKEDDVWDALEQAIHGGVLEHDRARPALHSPLRFSVPSLRTYASTGFDKMNTRKVLREAEERDVRRGR